MNDFSVVRQGIKGGPPFSVNGRAVETLADEALDRIKAELIRLRNYHQDPVEVARLRERIKELETFRNGENNEWWMAEVTRLREEIAERQVNLDGWADRAEEAEAELARQREERDRYYREIVRLRERVQYLEGRVPADDVLDAREENARLRADRDGLEVSFKRQGKALDLARGELAALQDTVHERDLRIVGLSAELARLQNRASELNMMNAEQRAENARLREGRQQALVAHAVEKQAKHNLEAENARLREIADKQAVALMKEIDEKYDELAQVREAANAEMKASLGYQTENARLREALEWAADRLDEEGLGSSVARNALKEAN